MPEFSPREVKTARAPITVKPSGLSCQTELYLVSNGTKVATSGIKPFTSTGAKQDISFPVTMPDAQGTYPVYLDVFVASQLIAAYQAIEDVTIVSPDPLQIVDGWWTPVSVIVPATGNRITAPQCTVVIRNNAIQLSWDEQGASILSGSFTIPLLKPYRTVWGYDINEWSFGPYDDGQLPAVGQQKQITVTVANTDLEFLLNNGYLTTEYEGIAAGYSLLVFWQHRASTKVIKLRRI